MFYVITNGKVRPEHFVVKKWGIYANPKLPEVSKWCTARDIEFDAFWLDEN